MSLVLASQSVYRRELLKKLGIEFTCATPTVNEEQLKTEFLKLRPTPVELAEKLSFEKGLSVFSKPAFSGSLVISGDQLVAMDNEILGKPATAENATAQLTRMNNKTHELITAVTLISQAGKVHFNHISRLKMKNLSLREIQNYVGLDRPFDCAGSYKIESHGITLFESVDCDDFTAIQGIPMIWLSNYLKGDGYELYNG